MGQRIKHFGKRVLKHWQVHSVFYVCIGAAILLAGSGIISMKAASSYHEQAEATQRAALQPKQHEHIAVDSAEPVAAPTEDSSSDNPATSTNVKSTQSAAKAPASAGSLVFSKSTITVQAGLSDTVTVSASNGAAIYMPMLASFSSNVTLNSSTSSKPKTSWTTSVRASDSAIPGTYVTKLTAQYGPSAFYSGTITVVVVPRVTFTTAVEHIGSLMDDEVHVKVTIIPKNGFTSPVSSVDFRSDPSGVTCSPDAGYSGYMIWFTCDTSAVSATNAGLYLTVHAGSETANNVVWL
jgi:hypothetical protein